MNAETKTGKIIIEGDIIRLERTGILGALASINEIIFFPLYFLMGVNIDTEIEIKKIEKVEYSYGIPNILRPHIKIYYGKKKPRLVIFKKPIRDVLNYKGAKLELEKVIIECDRLGIKRVKI